MWISSECSASCTLPKAHHEGQYADRIYGHICIGHFIQHAFGWAHLIVGTLKWAMQTQHAAVG